MKVPKINRLLWASLRHRGDTQAIASLTGKNYMTVHRALHGNGSPELIEAINQFYEARKKQTQCYIPTSLQQALSQL